MMNIRSTFFVMHQKQALSIALSPIVCLAKHLAVALVGSSALAPRLYMVGIHILYSPNARAVGIVTNGAQRTVACACRTGIGGLAAVDTPLNVVVEYNYTCFITSAPYM